MRSSEPSAVCQMTVTHPRGRLTRPFLRGLFDGLLYSGKRGAAMSLAEKIQKDLVDAMRAKDELRLSVLRGIKAAIKHKEVEKIRALDDAESIQILQTLVKQR